MLLLIQTNNRGAIPISVASTVLDQEACQGINRLTGVFGCLLVLCALILTAGCGSDSAGDQPTSDSSTSTLSGTTRVTLKPRTEDGRAPTDQSLDKAEQILRDRVNAFGVFGVRVESVGDTFVITIPGDARAKADTLGRAARATTMTSPMLLAMAM